MGAELSVPAMEQSPLFVCLWEFVTCVGAKLKKLSLCSAEQSAFKSIYLYVFAGPLRELFERRDELKVLQNGAGRFTEIVDLIVMLNNSFSSTPNEISTSLRI
jgi:hypothetical protein